MELKTSLYIALVIFGLGVVYKVSTWFRHSLSPQAEAFGPGKRIAAVLKGISGTLFGPGILTLGRVLVLDVILQRRILRESALRWAMHMCIYGGFMALLFMHALGFMFFADFQSTVNPFLFLRDLFGVIVVVGLGISFYRRHILKIPRLVNNAMDHYMVAILAAIMLTGFLLQASQITSHSVYEQMVQDYSDIEDEDELKALEAFWVENYGVVSPGSKPPFDADLLELGAEANEMNCADCHAPAQAAFVSYAVSAGIRPIALYLNRIGFHDILYYFHFWLCLIGLAYLPFSRMFHIIVSPISLLANAVADPEKSDPAVVAVRQIMELDACTHCGTCSVNCFVGVMFEEAGNANILPSEKLASVKKFVAGKTCETDVGDIQEGLMMCANCRNCTVVCPVGINLQELWFSARETALKEGGPQMMALSSFSFYRGLKKEEIESGDYAAPADRATQALEEKFADFGEADISVNLEEGESEFKKSLSRLSINGNTFASCFACTTCTSVCPVANQYEDSPGDLGIGPHQIIHSAVMGFDDLIFRSKMLWSCLGCYECQEACPQGVPVTDVFYEIKNMAARRIKEDSQRV
ncbi:conserved membrane hypothetical protein [Candidatus Desulfarcum epimagneticum]|uniref:4Fe-4S ferredoxin-type domain-containing protein n=1 Tax=uncultured Desulfobacteraceae bacterium TaxID=218296 RepID=A0A484HPB6_9BACT|nr:conserved membrane hypothetical protein [uncultured Desulfobacteraceae bacterium]